MYRQFVYAVLMKFEWDETKNEANIKKHGISFSLASRVFETARFTERSDREGEERYIAIGEVYGKLIAVAYTMRSERIRVISARRSRKNERRKYKNLYF